MKTVNIKTKKPPAALMPAASQWRKYSFYFASSEECNNLAIPIAATLRRSCPKVYFARYNGAIDHRLDVYFCNDSPMPEKDALAFVRKEHMGWTKMVGPTPCEGSDAHAYGMDCVLKVTAALMETPQEQRTAAVIDVIHWMFNMFGYDYVQEAQCYLASLERIMAVFDNSIKLGNKMSKAAKRTVKAGKANSN